MSNEKLDPGSVEQIESPHHVKLERKRTIGLAFRGAGVALGGLGFIAAYGGLLFGMNKLADYAIERDEIKFDKNYPNLPESLEIIEVGETQVISLEPELSQDVIDNAPAISFRYRTRDNPENAVRRLGMGFFGLAAAGVNNDCTKIDRNVTTEAYAKVTTNDPALEGKLTATMTEAGLEICNISDKPIHGESIRNIFLEIEDPGTINTA